MSRWPHGFLYALAVLANLFWAGAYVTGKVAIAGFGPFRASFFRFALAGVVLALWGLLRRPETLRVRRADLPRFGRLALLGMCLTYVFNYTGLALTTGTATPSPSSPPSARSWCWSASPASSAPPPEPAPPRSPKRSPRPPGSNPTIQPVSALLPLALGAAVAV